jgi:hypothetical protein
VAVVSGFGIDIAAIIPNVHCNGYKNTVH